MDDIKSLFGKRLRELRKANNLTQEQLAEKIGIEPRNLIKIENAKTFPRTKTLEKISEVLGVKPRVLFSFEHHQDIKTIKNLVIKEIKENDELARLVYKMIV